MPRLSFLSFCNTSSCYFTFFIPVSARCAFCLCLALRCIAHWEPRRLFKHQALAIDAAVSGLHVALSTATSSGKSVVFNVSVLEAILGPRPEAVAIYLFPTKALAQDQLRCAWFLSLFARRIASMYLSFADHSSFLSPAPRLASPLLGPALPSGYCRYRGLYDLSASNVPRPSVQAFLSFSFFFFFHVHLKTSRPAGTVSSIPGGSKRRLWSPSCSIETNDRTSH